MNKMSTMLGIFFFSSLFFNINSAKADDACTSYSVDDVKNSSEKVIICTGTDGKQSVIDVAKERSRLFGITPGGAAVVKWTPVDKLSKKKLREYGFINATGGGSSSGNGGGSGGGNGGGNGGGGVVVGGNGNVGGNGGGGVIVGGGNGNVNGGGNGGGHGGGTVYRTDPAVQARIDFDALKDFCGGLNDRIADRDDAQKDVQAQIDAINASLPGLQAAADRAYKSAMTGCRKDCLRMAITKDGTCSLPPEKIAEMVSKEDLNNKLLGVDIYFGGQSKYIEFINGNQNPDTSKVCSKIMMKAECKAEIVKAGAIADCEESVAWLAALKALDDAQKQIADLKARQSGYARNSSGRSCTITTAADTRKPQWDTCSADCLQKALDGCPNILAQAEVEANRRPSYCPDCGVNGNGQGGGQCAYGNCGGVSKAAQIIAALGGPVSSIAGGLINMSIANNGLSACTSSYSQYLNVMTNVGMSPQGPMCGGMMGMGGGFSGSLGMGQMGINGMGGGMYNPYGMGGMGGMGMNGGMYNPYGMGGMGGMGNGIGINAGINLGLGGMGGGMYNPYGGGMYGGGMGMGGGINPYIMGGGIGGGMYGGGMGGGMYNPMMGGGMYGGGMGGGMGVQTQMYNAQLQMQQNAAQQVAIQNSMMNGYNNGSSMYGMGNMGQSPYYGMGGGNMYGGGMGMGTGYGYGNYNPYGSGMYGGGNGLGFSAGINAGVGFY